LEQLKAVLLVGGPGTRMRPLTYVIPKCLLPVGGKPLVERTIQYLQAYGINEFVLCVAYLKKQVIDTIKDGKELGVTIEYAESDVPLGTAGQLKTAQAYLRDTFLAMNGDIVTDLNVRNLIECHRRNQGVATLAVKNYGVRIPYGYITVDKNSVITAFKEKPTIHYLANAGVYVMEPRILEAIPPGQQCSLETETFPDLLSRGEKINSYFEEANWADVGSMADFERVNDQVLSQSRRPPSREEDQSC
jgi:mannose-1-phosphate guanylyltransferase